MHAGKDAAVRKISGHGADETVRLLVIAACLHRLRILRPKGRMRWLKLIWKRHTRLAMYIRRDFLYFRLPTHSLAWHGSEHYFNM